MLGSDAALLGWCQVGGELEGSKILEGLGDFPEAVFDGGGLWGKGVRCITTEHGAGVAKKGASITVIGDSVRTDQRKSIAGRKRVPLDDTDESILVTGGEGTEAVGKGGTYGTRGQFLLGSDTEVAADFQATLHPLAALAEEAGNLGDAQMIVVDERADYPCLIEGCDGAWGRIGGQQQPLVLVGSCGCFEHHGKFSRLASLFFCRKALEAINDLEGAIVGGHDAQGQRCRITREALLCGAWTQAGVGGAQSADGYHAKRACGAVRGHGLRRADDRACGSRRL